mmetsp:Transcript_8430/g.27118  ORF Transcript_8430/g.27118 Transcript_8430/m.27118 type:complete len:292 (-) Transcript_8430:1753-2628(-)
MKVTALFGVSRWREISCRTSAGQLTRPMATLGKKAAHSSAWSVSRLGPPSAAAPEGGSASPWSARSLRSRAVSSRLRYSISESRLYDAFCDCAYCAAAGGPPAERRRCHSSNSARLASGSEQPREVKRARRGLKKVASSAAASASAVPSAGASAAAAAAPSARVYGWRKGSGSVSMAASSAPSRPHPSASPSTSRRPIGTDTGSAATSRPSGVTRASSPALWAAAGGGAPVAGSVESAPSALSAVTAAATREHVGGWIASLSGWAGGAAGSIIFTLSTRLSREVRSISAGV